MPHVEHSSAKSSSHPTIYLIRHAEKPPKIRTEEIDEEGNAVLEDDIGLSSQGETRAHGLRRVFGKDSGYNIGFIMAQKPKGERRTRPLLTVEPLAQDLGLPVDISVGRDNHDGAAELAKSFKGPGNVLICWEHKALSGIVEAMGVKGYAKSTGLKGKVEYPKGRFDVIWCVNHPYKEIGEVKYEGIEGLDDGPGDGGKGGKVELGGVREGLQGVLPVLGDD